MNLTVISTGWNPPTKERCIESVRGQRGVGLFTHHVIDASQQRPTKAHFENLSEIIRDLPDDEIVVCVDLDDWLARDDALAIVKRAHEAGAWMTWGSFRFADGRAGFARNYDPGENERTSPWGASHLKTFRAGLFKQIKEDDLKLEGEWCKHARDHVLMFPMMEMAGFKRRRFIPQVLYVYNLETSTFATGTEEEHREEERIRQAICARPPYAPIADYPRRRRKSGKDPSTIYTAAWYEAEYADQGPSIDTVAEVLAGLFRPRKVIDVGCGPGMLVRALYRRGIAASGFDGSRHAIEYAHRIAPDLRDRLKVLDITASDLPSQLEKWAAHGYDLVISTEVAEHLEAEHADQLVEIVTLLCRNDGSIVFTAAPPGQGGHDHVNEQPPEYWIEKFSSRGFRLNLHRTAALKYLWQPVTRLSHLSKNVLVFERRS